MTTHLRMIQKSVIIIAAVITVSLVAGVAWTFPGSSSLLMGSGMAPVSGGGGGACTYGQSFSGSVPTEASNAGFSTCALNSDFSDASYATQSNWLDTAATDGTKIWHCGNLPFTLPSGQPACDFNQTTDPLDSSTVLRARWLTSYSSGTSAEFINTYISSSAYLDFPNFYVEANLRIDTTNASGSFSEAAVWAGGQRATSAVNTEMEQDFVELATGSGGIGDAALHNWANGGSCGSPCQFLWNTPPTGVTGWTVTGYHRYGWLRTSNGSTHTYVCAFVDDVFQGCLDAAPTSTQYTEGAYLIMDNSCNFSSGSCPTMNMYVKSVRVWSCSNWHVNAGTSRTSTNQCNNTTLFTSGTLPTGGTVGGLTYYHP